MPKAQGEDVVLQMTADGVARLTPDMLLALVRHSQSEGERAQIASAVIDRVTDETAASFVANAIVKERGASERLAQALEALVVDGDHKQRLLDLAKEEAGGTPFGREASFEELWQSATDMLTSYIGRALRLGRLRARALGRTQAGHRRGARIRRSGRANPGLARDHFRRRGQAARFSAASRSAQGRKGSDVVGGDRRNRCRRSRATGARGRCAGRATGDTGDRARSRSGRARAAAGRSAIYGRQSSHPAAWPGTWSSSFARWMTMASSRSRSCAMPSALESSRRWPMR